MNQTDYIKVQLQEAADVLSRFLNDDQTISSISEAITLMGNCLKDGGKIISCGNGGSMCDAMHFAEELSGRFRNDRVPLAALSISDPSHLSCVGNDYGYAEVFARYIGGLGNKGDVLLAISTSGNSENVIRAIEVAQKKGMKIVGLSGKDGGKMASMCDIEIRAPHSQYADRAQEIHIKVIHNLIGGIERMM
jgi:D-sedoheptulose 7-phosphate isomerase